MNIKSVVQHPRAFSLVWDDDYEQELPFIWLRDNDPSELHPHTQERVFDLTSVSLDLQPVAFAHQSQVLTVRWPDRHDDAIYPSHWLQNFRADVPAKDPADISRVAWRAGDHSAIERFAAAHCQSPDGLSQLLSTLKRKGIALIDALEDCPNAGANFGDLIGFKRESNFGVMFDVISKPDPNNLAYTSIALPLHTDLPNQELVPGYQFLHCYKNSTTGGGSLLADGLAIVNDFKRECPAHYELLANTPIGWRFHDQECDIRRQRAIIELDESGDLRNFTFNAHIADVVRLPSDTIYSFYAAYQALMQRVRGAGYCISYTLQPGEMVIFDNRRVLHGREAFDPSAGERHLRGYYIEHNEVDSKLRILARALSLG